MSPFTPPAGGPILAPRPPARVVSLFDGQCGVCTRSAGWIGARDVEGRIERLDLRDPAAAERFPSLSPEAVRAQMHAVDVDGRVFVGIDAVSVVFAALPRWWVLGRALRWPGVHAVADVLYRWFARNRLWFNRWFPAPAGEHACDGEGCAVDWAALERQAERPASP
jgi:predicted DCC family thiol-disulfide oxidoreductase YuxK